MLSSSRNNNINNKSSRLPSLASRHSSPNGSLSPPKRHASASPRNDTNNNNNAAGSNAASSHRRLQSNAAASSLGGLSRRQSAVDLQHQQQYSLKNNNFKAREAVWKRQKFCRHMFLVFKFIGALLLKALPGRLTVAETAWLFDHFASAGELKEPAQVARLLSVMGITAGTEEVAQIMRDICFFKEGSLMDFRQFKLLAKFFKKRFEEFKKIPASLVAFVALGGNWEKDEHGEYGDVQTDILRETVNEFQLTTDVDKFIKLVDTSGDGMLQYGEFRVFIDDGKAQREEEEERRRKDQERAEMYDQYGRRRKRKKVFKTRPAPPKPEIEDPVWDPYALLDDPEKLLEIDDGTSGWVLPGSDDDDDDDGHNNKKINGKSFVPPAAMATSSHNDVSPSASMNNPGGEKTLQSEDSSALLNNNNNNNNSDEHNNNNNNEHQKVRIVDPDLVSVGESAENNNNNMNNNNNNNSIMYGDSTSNNNNKVLSRKNVYNNNRNHPESSTDDLDDAALTPSTIFAGVGRWIKQNGEIDSRLGQLDRTQKYREENFGASVLGIKKKRPTQQHNNSNNNGNLNSSVNHAKSGNNLEDLGASGYDQSIDSGSLYGNSAASYNNNNNNNNPHNNSNRHQMPNSSQSARATAYNRPWHQAIIPAPPSSARQPNRKVRTSALTQTGFGASPRFFGDAPLAPLPPPGKDSSNNNNYHHGSTSPSSRGMSRESGHRNAMSSQGSKRKHFRDGPATVRAVQEHISKTGANNNNSNYSAASSRRESGTGECYNNNNNSRPITATSQQNNNNNNVANSAAGGGGGNTKWYERDPFAAPPPAPGSPEHQRQNTKLPEIRHQRTGRTMMVQPDFVF